MKTIAGIQQHEATKESGLERPPGMDNEAEVEPKVSTNEKSPKMEPGSYSGVFENSDFVEDESRCIIIGLREANTTQIEEVMMEAEENAETNEENRFIIIGLRVQNSTMTQDAAKECQEYMKRDPENLNFVIVALAGAESFWIEKGLDGRKSAPINLGPTSKTD